jgi:hypothetical protein
LKYVLKLNVTHDDVFMKLFVFSLEMKERVWVSYCSGPRTIVSCVYFVNFFSSVGVSIYKSLKMHLKTI